MICTYKPVFDGSPNRVAVLRWLPFASSGAGAFVLLCPTPDELEYFRFRSGSAPRAKIPAGTPSIPSHATPLASRKAASGGVPACRLARLGGYKHFMASVLWAATSTIRLPRCHSGLSDAGVLPLRNALLPKAGGWTRVTCRPFQRSRAIAETSAGWQRWSWLNP